MRCVDPLSSGIVGGCKENTVVVREHVKVFDVRVGECNRDRVENELDSEWHHCSHRLGEEIVKAKSDSYHHAAVGCGQGRNCAVGPRSRCVECSSWLAVLEQCVPVAIDQDTVGCCLYPTIGQKMLLRRREHRAEREK